MPDTTIDTIKPNEDKEVLEAKVEQAKEYYLTPKYKLWEEYFFDKRNRETFGNATRAACAAYNLDPEDPKAYNIASVIGHKNTRKVKNLRKRYWEARGLTHGKLLDLYNNMMVERKDINLLYSVADDMGVELPEYKTIINAKQGLNVNNTQINVEGGVNLGQLDDTQLKQFIESKRFALRSTTIAGSGAAIEGESVEVHSIPQEAVRSDK